MPRSDLAFGLVRHPRRTASGLLLVALLVPPLVSELVVAVAPSLASYALYGVAAAFLQCICFTRPWKQHLVGLLGLAGALLVVHLVPWHSRKVFLAEFDRVEAGMSVEQVHSLLAPVSILPELQASLIERGYRHSAAARFDSDIGMVRFTDGHVTGTQFLPD